MSPRGFQKTCFLHIIHPKRHGRECFYALLYTLMMLHGSHTLMLHTCLILHALTATSTPSPGSFSQADTLCSPPYDSLQSMANGAEVP